MPKRLIVANDLPGLGKVALAASLPVLAACQIESVILPTVLLSSHTGGFPDVVSKDCTEPLVQFLQQWKSIGLQADGMLVGYCRSAQQLELLGDYAREQGIPLILDPIMGDNGCLYTGFDQDYGISMRELVRQSAVVMPNLTEAAFLTETPFLDKSYGQEEVENLLFSLGKLGAQHVIVTGVSFQEGQIGFAYLNRERGEISYHMSQSFSGHFFGTGDLVATLIAAAFVENIPFTTVFPLILDFLDKSLESTLALERERKYGVFFEPHLGHLAREFQDLIGATRY